MNNFDVSLRNIFNIGITSIKAFSVSGCSLIVTALTVCHVNAFNVKYIVINATNAVNGLIIIPRNCGHRMIIVLWSNIKLKGNVAEQTLFSTQNVNGNWKIQRQLEK